MTNIQFNILCNLFGDPSKPITERWKCVRYIYVKNPLLDVQSYIRENGVIYVDNTSIGPGFYILGAPNSDLGIPNNLMVVTFVPLESIKKIVFNVSESEITGEIDLEDIDFIINNNEIDDKRININVYLDNYPDEEYMTIIE